MCSSFLSFIQGFFDFLGPAVNQGQAIIIAVIPPQRKQASTLLVRGEVI